MKPLTMLNINSIKALILDMDGVIWRGPQPIGDLPAIFSRFKYRGWKVALATNNATRTIDQYVERLNSFGVNVEPWQVINSAVAAAIYLKAQFPSGGAVYTIGEAGLTEALAEQGFIHAEQNVLAVVVSMDRHLTYEKLRRATLLIRRGALFIATNPDRTFPTPEGLVPGAGAILAALEAACYTNPVVVGKPSPAMYHIALERLGTLATETLVVGDRPETDIAGAQAIGCRSALVLSGVSSSQDAAAWQPAPDLILPDLDAISSYEIK
jgi:4-nitrophenyl phosphatase